MRQYVTNYQINEIRYWQRDKKKDSTKTNKCSFEISLGFDMAINVKMYI